MGEDDGGVFQDMISGRIKDIREAIDEIEGEIKQRRDIDERVLEEIRAEILKVRNRILEVEQFTGSSQSGELPGVDTLEREVVSLEGEKRMESVSCWRDLTSLRKELRLYMRELNDLLRKAKMVRPDAGSGEAA